jgi:hypothetical protein
LTGRAVPRDGRGVTDVLVVTTTVRVVDGVHRHTTSPGPAVPLGTHGVVFPAGLEEGLVDTATARSSARALSKIHFPLLQY